MFDYNSERAQLARLQRRVGGKMSQYVLLAIVSLAALSILALLFVGSVGWIFVALALLLFMPYTWERHLLNSLPESSGGAMHDRLEVTLLARMPRELSTKALLQALPQVTSAQFVMIRSGLSPKLLEDTYEDAPEMLSLAWSAVSDLQPKGIVTGATLLAALVKVSPNSQQLLPHLQLDVKDVEAMAAWYAHLDELIAAYKMPRRTGGIARDLGFGYMRYLDRFGVNVSDRVMATGHIQVDVASHKQALEFMTKTFG